MKITECCSEIVVAIDRQFVTRSNNRNCLSLTQQYGAFMEIFITFCPFCGAKIEIKEATHES